MKHNRTKPMPSKSQREASLSAVPYQLPRLRQKEENGKLYVTIQMLRPRWQTFLGADVMCERTFGLDDYGRRVYESCNGERQVRHIIHNFARDTKISKPEAETAVTRFMRILMIKGLIAMEMEKPQS